MSILSDVLDLADEEEAPTYYAMDEAQKLLLNVQLKLGELPRGYACEFDGGVRIEFRGREHCHAVLSVGRNEEAKSYIYLQVPGAITSWGATAKNLADALKAIN